MTTTSTTTAARGFGAVSGADEIAFAYQTLNPTGRVEWTQPAMAEETWAAGRAEGLMVRSSLNTQSPMVFFGYQCDATPTPQLVLLWRKTGAPDIFTKQISIGDLSPAGGVLQIRLEWMRHYVVASYFKDTTVDGVTTSNWRPLYAFDLDDDAASLPSQVYGGLAFASGVGAEVWGSDVADAATWTGRANNSCWWKVSEPWVSSVWTVNNPIGPLSNYHPDVLPRQAFLASSWSYASTSPADWLAASDPWLTNGDQFYLNLTSANTPVTVSMQGPCPGNEAIDVFMRWGSVAGASAVQNVSVQVLRSFDGNTLNVSSLNEQVDPDLWVYLGAVPAVGVEDRGDTLITTVQTAAETSGFLSIDGVLYLSRSDEVDLNANGIPDWWENQSYTDASLPLTADGDYNGDGISNTDEYSLGATLASSLFSGYAATPKLRIIRTDGTIAPATVLSDSRITPIDIASRLPLQVIATYSGNGAPLKGYPITFSDIFLQHIAFTQSLEDTLQLGTLPVYTDSTGTASAYITYKNNPNNSNDQVHVASGAGNLTFNVTPYHNHPIGPIDISPVTSRFTQIQTLDRLSGGVSLSGPWLAVANAQSGSAPGQVQLYKWESDTGSWRPAIVLTSPLTPPAADGFGALVKLSGDFLAVLAPSAGHIFIYHHDPDTDSWALEGDMSTTGTIDEIAISSGYLATGSNSGTSINLFKRVASTETPVVYSWQSTGSPLTVNAITSPDFHRRLLFGDNGSDHYFFASDVSGSPEVGLVNVYHLNSSNAWIPLSTTPLAQDPPDLNEAFGNSLAFADGQLAIGAPVKDDATDPSALGAAFVYGIDVAGGELVASRMGTARNFGAQLWLGQSHLVTAFNSTASPPANQAFDKLSLFKIDLTVTGIENCLVSRQTLCVAGASAVMEGDALFVAGILPTNGITDFQLIPQLSNGVSVDALVTNFHVNDADGDMIGISLSQPDVVPPNKMLQMAEATAPSLWSNQLKVGSSLAGLADTIQWFELSATDLAGGLYQESYRLQITGTLPGAPSAFTASATGKTSVQLSWADTDPTVTLFHVERAPLDKNQHAGDTVPVYHEIALVDGQFRSFVDTTVSYSQDSTTAYTQDYVYRLSAENLEGPSGSSILAELHWDTDSSGIGNGIPDWWEALFAGVDPLTFDPNLTIFQKYLINGNPTLTDTDGDGDPDATDTSPLDANTNRVGLMVFTQLHH